MMYIKQNRENEFQTYRRDGPAAAWDAAEMKRAGRAKRYAKAGGGV